MARTVARPATKATRAPKAAPKDGDASGAGKADDVGDLRGIRRTLAILQHITLHPGRAIDITHALGLPWATVYRGLNQLEEAGLIRRDPKTNRYEIGQGMWVIGSTYVANHPVLRAASASLHEASDLENVVIQVAERAGDLSINIYTAEPQRNDIGKALYGFHFPLHCGSKGHVLLAFADEDFAERYLSQPLARMTADTITSPDELRSVLRTVRSRDWAVTLGDVQPHTGSIAAPIRDQSGHVVAALSFVGRKATIANDAKREALLETLMRMAHATSMNLGWRPGLVPGTAPARGGSAGPLAGAV